MDLQSHGDPNRLAVVQLPALKAGGVYIGPIASISDQLVFINKWGHFTPDHMVFVFCGRSLGKFYCKKLKIGTHGRATYLGNSTDKP